MRRTQTGSGSGVSEHPPCARASITAPARCVWAVCGAIVLILALTSCQSTPQQVLITEEELVQIERPSGIPLCSLNYRAMENACFTSVSALGQPPAKVLHRRLMSSLHETGDLDSDDSMAVASCTSGFQFSCEMDAIIRSEGYRRDKEVIIEIYLVMNRHTGSGFAEATKGKSIFPQNYDPQNPDQFEQMLRNVIRFLKHHDGQWQHW